MGIRGTTVAKAYGVNSPSPSDSSDAPTSSRREFLRCGLWGAATAAMVGLPLARGAADAAQPQADGPKMPMLGADGQVHHPVMPAGLPASDPQVRIGVPGRRWVMVIDLAKCDGCGKCTVGCNKMHRIPSDRQWLKVYKMADDDGRTYWFPKPCFHCDNPPCTKVCPVGATFKRQDGVVLVDNERCIGCRFCMAACPYSTRVFNWGQPPKDSAIDASTPSPETGLPRRMGTVEKCDFCVEMAGHGQLPSCVTSCGMGAIYYGDENEDAVTNGQGETVRLRQFLAERAGYQYLEELGTKPRVHYLPPRNRIYPGPKSEDSNANV